MVTNQVWKLLTRRSLIATGILVLAISGLGYFAVSSTMSSYAVLVKISPLYTADDYYKQLRGAQLLELTCVGCALLGVVALLMGYLRSDQESDSSAYENKSILPVSSEFDNDRVSTSGDLTVATQKELEQQQAIDAPPPTASDPREARIGNLFDSTQARLRNEIQDLGRRSNLNLAVGVAVTMTATGVLIYLVTRPHPDFIDVANVLSYYIPRVTTIVLIETFAYFFLGLYKANLAEIKYYQNERTTVAALEIAWRASLWPEIGDSTSVVIRQICKTDRNPLQTNDGKRTDSDHSEMLDILKSVSSIAAESLKSKDK